MSTHDREPLTPEERDLAQRLSRLGGHAAPSASLDARILAAAQAAVSEPSAAARTRLRRRPRWPFGVGIAASLAVALGIAWQLRPQPESVALPAASEESLQYGVPAIEAPKPEPLPSPPVSADDTFDAADTAAVEEPADAMPATAMRALRAPAPPPEPAPVAAAPPGEAPIVFDETVLKRAAAAEDSERRQREETVFDVAAPAAAAPPAPAPPPPPPPAAPASAPEARGFVASPPPAATAIGANTQIARERKASAQSAAAAAEAGATLDQIVVTGSRIEHADMDGHGAPVDQPFDDQPPASADAPEVRDAWLRRIRELRAAGQLDDARASLREFVRRHPDTAVPDDLRPLLGE